MKKIILSICCILLAATVTMAQEGGAITATLKDANTNEGINGAVIELTNLATQKQHYYTSGHRGVVNIKHLAPAKYKVTITYLGYKDLVKEVKVSTSTVKLGTVLMKQEATMLEGIQVKGYMGTSQKGDTISYNAAAFKTARDASTEGLLKKMPGITVNADGSVDAQGETIQKVYVDGKEFFGEDVSTTIKTIPAEVVSKVEVYDKLSDKAEFTGLDDGEGFKALNIVTSLGKRKGYFGKAYTSYGYPDKYSVGGNVNMFHGDEKISVIAMANNINQLNFSFEDIVGATSSSNVASSGGGGGMRHNRAAQNFMVPHMSGISTVQSVGVNYANQWKKFELQGSYFFNHSNTVNERSEDRITYGSEDYTQLYNSRSASQSDNWNHRLNMRADYKFSKWQSLMMRANVSLQKYDSWSEASSITKDGITEQVQKDMVQTGNDDRYGTYGNVFLLYRTRLGKAGRTLTVNGGGNWSDNRNTSNPMYSFTIINPADSLYEREIERLSSSNRIRAEITYTEPINKDSQLNLEYEFSHKFDNQNLYTDVYINETLMPDLGLLLSNVSESGYSIHQVGPGYNLSTKKIKFSAKLNYQYSNFSSKQILPEGANPNYSFSDFTYRGNATFNFNRQNTLRVRFRSNTDNPSLGQLQEAITVSGDSYTEGNPNLKPSYSHRINAFYNHTNIEKGRTFMLHGGLWATSRSIISSSVMNSPDFVLENYDNQLLGVGNTYTTYENHTGDNYNFMVGVSYGFPLNFIKSNATIGAHTMFSKSPSKINNYLNIMSGNYYSGSVQLSSNISENLDFSMFYSLSYNINDNTSEVTHQLNKYFSQYASAELKWVVWRDFTLTANASYDQHRGITDSYNEEKLMCNAYIGKKIFRDRRGELSIGVNDIFDQNKDFRRSVGPNYISNTTNLAIGRYVAVQFVYNLRIFGKGSSAKDFDNLQGVGGGRPMGPPGGGRGRHH